MVAVVELEEKTLTAEEERRKSAAGRRRRGRRGEGHDGCSASGEDLS